MKGCSPHVMSRQEAADGAACMPFPSQRRPQLTLDHLLKPPLPDQGSPSPQSHATGQTVERELSPAFPHAERQGESESLYSDPGLAEEEAFAHEDSPGLLPLKASVQGPNPTRLRGTEASFFSSPPPPGAGASIAAQGPDLFLPTDLPTWAEYAPEEEAIGTAWTELVPFEEAVSSLPLLRGSTEIAT